jgi:hypothetical protein
LFVGLGGGAFTLGFILLPFGFFFHFLLLPFGLEFLAFFALGFSLFALLLGFGFEAFALDCIVFEDLYGLCHFADFVLSARTNHVNGVIALGEDAHDLGQAFKLAADRYNDNHRQQGRESRRQNDHHNRYAGDSRFLCGGICLGILDLCAQVAGVGDQNLVNRHDIVARLGQDAVAEHPVVIDIGINRFERFFPHDLRERAYFFDFLRMRRVHGFEDGAQFLCRLFGIFFGFVKPANGQIGEPIFLFAESPKRVGCRIQLFGNPGLLGQGFIGRADFRFEVKVGGDQDGQQYGGEYNEPVADRELIDDRKIQPGKFFGERRLFHNGPHNHTSCQIGYSGEKFGKGATFAPFPTFRYFKITTLIAPPNWPSTPPSFLPPVMSRSPAGRPAMAGEAGFAVILRQNEAECLPALERRILGEMLAAGMVRRLEHFFDHVVLPFVGPVCAVAYQLFRRGQFEIGLSARVGAEFFGHQAREHRRKKALKTDVLAVDGFLRGVHDIADGLDLGGQQLALAGAGVDTAEIGLGGFFVVGPCCFFDEISGYPFVADFRIVDMLLIFRNDGPGAAQQRRQTDGDVFIGCDGEGR